MNVLRVELMWEDQISCRACWQLYLETLRRPHSAALHPDNQLIGRWLQRENSSWSEWPASCEGNFPRNTRWHVGARGSGAVSPPGTDWIGPLKAEYKHFLKQFFIILHPDWTECKGEECKIAFFNLSTKHIGEIFFNQMSFDFFFKMHRNQCLKMAIVTNYVKSGCAEHQDLW